MTLKNGSVFPSGAFMSEAYIPIYHWQNIGIDVEAATCGGLKPHIDEQSLIFMSKVKKSDSLAYFEETPILIKPLVLEDLTGADLDLYDGLYIAGSYAIVEELIENSAFIKLLDYFYKEKKLILLMSQSVYLLSILNEHFKANQSFPVITCFPEEKERALETVTFKDALPFYIESTLAQMGYTIQNNPSPLRPNVIQSKNIITGQDFYSAGAISRLCQKLYSSKNAIPNSKL
jgi:putative intracellular protease/amidase